MENNVIEKNKSKNIIIGILVFVIVLLLAVLIYFLFIKKDNPKELVNPQNNQQTNNQSNNNDNDPKESVDPQNNQQTNNQSNNNDNDPKESVDPQNNQSNNNDNITIAIGNNEVKKIDLGETNTTIKVNNKNIKLKVINDILYVNDVKQKDVMLEGIVFATNKYILVAGVGLNGCSIDYAVDENGNVINVYKSVVADSSYPMYQVNNIRIENGKVVADYFRDSCTMMPVDTKDCEKKVEFVYDGNNIIMTDISLPQNTKALTRIELEEADTLIQFNGKQIKLKSSSGSIYYNDKLVKSFTDMNNFGFYVSEKIILIYWIGNQCNPVFIGAINENGEFVEVKNPNGDYVYGLYAKDGVIMGTANVCQTEPDESKKYNAKFVYDGKTVTLIKVK